MDKSGLVDPELKKCRFPLICGLNLCTCFEECSDTYISNPQIVTTFNLLFERIWSHELGLTDQFGGTTSKQ